MNKKLLIIAAAVIVAIGAFAMVSKDSGGPEIQGGVENALPAYSPKKEHILFVSRELPKFGEYTFLDLLDGLFSPEFLSEMLDNDYSDMLPDDIADAQAAQLERVEEMGEGYHAVRNFLSVINSADEIAIYADRDSCYITVSIESATFASFVEDPQTLIPDSKIVEEKKIDDKSTRLTVQLEADAPNSEIFMLAVDRGSAHKQIMIADSEEELALMTRAASGKAARAEIKRYEKEPSFVQFATKHTLQQENAKPFFYEIAWANAADNTRFATYSAPLGDSYDFKTSGIEAQEKVPYFGTQTPFALMTLDIPYIFSILSYTLGEGDLTDDVIDTFISQAGIPLDDDQLADVRSLLTGSRISGGVTFDPKAMNVPTMYAYLELKDGALLDKYFPLAQFLMSQATIEGWDQAVSMSYDPTMTITAARNKNAFLIGMGQPSEFKPNVIEPAKLSGLQNSNVIMSCYIDFSLLNDENTLVGGLFKEALTAAANSPSEYPGVRFIEVFINSVDKIVSNQTSVDRSEAIIYWAKPKSE